MPNYPTDNMLASTLTFNNVSDYREPKLQTVEVVAASVTGQCTASVAHGLAVNDIVKFTKTSGSIVAGTTYYVKTLTSPTIFIVSASIGGGAVVGGDTTTYYYTTDGILTGAELTGITETINDFAAVFTNTANELADTIPASTSVDGNSVLAKLAKEITLFYDELDQRREALGAAQTNALDRFALVDNGFTNRQPVRFINDATNVHDGTTYYVRPFDGTAALLDDTITYAAHGFAVSDIITPVTAVTGFTVGNPYYIKPYTAPVVATTDALTLANHGFIENDIVRTTSAAQQANFASSTNYHVVSFISDAINGDPVPTDIIPMAAHAFTAGDQVEVTTGIAGIIAGTYYVITVVAGVSFKLTTILGDAGSIVSATADGTISFMHKDKLWLSAAQGGAPVNATGNGNVVFMHPDKFLLSTAALGATVNIAANGAITFLHKDIFTVSATTTGGLFNVGGDDATQKVYVASYDLTSDDLKYLANAKSLKINDLQAQALKLLFELKRLTANIEGINDYGEIPTSMYPSGQIY
jgi:hypothetical protein